MKERLNEILIEGENKIAGAKTLIELQEVKAALLGKQGLLTEIFKSIPKLDISMRSEIGAVAQKVKTTFETILKNKKEEIESKLSEI